MSVNLQLLAKEFKIEGDVTASSLTPEVCTRITEGEHYGLLQPPEDYMKPNLLLRWEVMEKARKSPEFQAAIKALALKDPILFFNLFLWTYDPRRRPYHFPFITYPFQDEYILWLVQNIVLQRDCNTLKSRDMGVSWLVLCVFFWFWLQPEAGNDFLLGSRKDEYVDKKGNMQTLFEKVRYLVRRFETQAPWMIPRGFKLGDRETDQTKQLLNPETGCILFGEANNPNFGSGGRFKGILFDEFCKWLDTDNAAWTSGMEASECRVSVSTYYSLGRKFHELCEDSDVEQFRIHWSLHPLKDDIWYSNRKRRGNPQEIAQELDMDPLGAAGKAFTPSYSPRIHFRDDVEFIWNLPMMRWWDFGYHHPICLFVQKDDYDRGVLLSLIKGRDVEADDFAGYVLNKSEEWFPECREWSDIGDPTSEHTHIKQIRDSTGISIRTTNTRNMKVNTLKDITAERLQEIWSEMIAGEPRFSIRKQPDDKGQRLPRFIATQSTFHANQAFSGGLHYPEKGGTFYEKDDIYDHIGDAMRYGIFVHFFSTLKKPSHKQVTQTIASQERRREAAMEVRNSGYTKGNKPSGPRHRRPAQRTPSRGKVLGRFL